MVTGETTIFGCALVSNETSDTYKWLLQTFSECMFDKHPQAIVTDGDPAMRDAIRCVFPNYRHRLCAWHIQKNVVEHVKNSDFLGAFNALIYANYTVDKFESVWGNAIEKYNLSYNNWVKKNVWNEVYMSICLYEGQVFCRH